MRDANLVEIPGKPVAASGTRLAEHHASTLAGCARSRSEAMLFLSGVASNVLDYLTAMQSPSQGTPPAGATSSAQGLFDSGSSGDANAGTATSGTAGPSDPPATASSQPWWSSPGTMNALLAVQGQSGVGASAGGGGSQLFASLENDLGSGSATGTESGANGIGSWWSSNGSTNGLFSAQASSGTGASAIGGFSQLFATLESAAGFSAPSLPDGTADGSDMGGNQGASGSGDAAQGAADTSGTSQSGTSQATSQTVTNTDGSTTTTISYPNGSTVTMTTAAAAATTASAPSGSTSFAGNLLQRLIHAQAQMFAAPGQSLSTLA
jgi:hypothetical protein